MAGMTSVGIRFGATRRRWQSFARWQKIGLVLLLAILAGWGTVSFYLWWTSWPARVVLEREGGHYPVAFSPDSSVVATTANRTGIIELWDVASGKKRATWANPDSRQRFQGNFSPDGATFACSTYHYGPNLKFSIDLIDVATGQTRATVGSPLAGGQLTQYFLNDGKTLRLIADDPATREVIDVDIATAKVVGSHPLSFPTAITFGNYSQDGRRYAFRPNGASASSPVTIWDIDLDKEECKLPILPAGGPIWRLEFAPDRKTLALGRADGSIELWDLSTRSLRLTIRGHSAGYSSRALRFSPDGSKLISVGQFYGQTFSPNTIRIRMAVLMGDQNHQTLFELIAIDTGTGRCLARGHQLGLANLFSPDGKTFATSSEDLNVRLRDVSTFR